MLRRWFVRALWSLALFSLPSRACAEERARLVYVRGPGAEGCPNEVDLRLRVVARLGYDPFSPLASRVVLARIALDEPARRLTGSVELVTADGLSSGRREHAAPLTTCDELARAMALSISLAVDPEQDAPRRPLETDSPPAPVAETKAPPPAPRTAPPTPVSPLRVTAGVAASSMIGALPASAFGGLGYLGLRARHFSAALEGRAVQSLGRDLVPRGSLSGNLLGPGLTSCGELGRLALCLVTLVGVQRLVSSDVSDARAKAALYAAAGPRITLRWPLGRGLSLTTSAEGQLNLARHRAVFAGSEVWRAPAASAGLLVGIDTSFL